MSEKMTPIPMDQLLHWTLEEYRKTGQVFGVHRPYHATHSATLFGKKLETPVGPAAGPHSQLAQNIIAAYFAGARFFELKTVQKMDGAELAACVARPCILAEEEGYNVEWSTELYVPQAMEEYLKAWIILGVIAKECDLGNMDGYQFNMSVGYDLEGIKGEKIDTFIEGMKDASTTKCFQDCISHLKENISLFQKVTVNDIESISPNVCNSVTLSTLHGCPPEEIEKIATYLLTEKKLNTFIKCNPTLLGYEFARSTMDEMGYDDMVFGEFHFNDDLQYKDAIPMLTRLMALGKEKNLNFGVKITNTFPVDNKSGRLPGDEMYMSGKALYPLSMALAAKLSKEFNGSLPISFSGGADFFNIQAIVKAGIFPVTVATTLLKPGGYQRLLQLAEITAPLCPKTQMVDPVATQKMATEARTSGYHVKGIKQAPSRKLKTEVPMTNCFIAPCKEGCPIHQDITPYLELVNQGQYHQALEVITSKNPLPFITGTICPHNCQSKCTRNFYESSVEIRSAKLIAAQNGYDALMKERTQTPKTGKKVAIIGGGPAGLSSAYFLAQQGAQVTIFEKEATLGGVVRHIIPSFRIEESAIENDINLVLKAGVEVKCNTQIDDISALKSQGFDAVIVAVGAHKEGVLNLEGTKPINALAFLRDFKKGNTTLGKNVVTIGGGNTAMDTARAVKKVKGVEHSYLVYRRTKRFMPADVEELEFALADGVEFQELLAPVKHEKGELLCDVMKLGEPDGSGRRSVLPTGEQRTIPCDVVIAAVGEKIDDDFLAKNNIKMDHYGAPVLSDTLLSSQPDIYFVGDGRRGPATVVEGIADAQTVATAISAHTDHPEHTVQTSIQTYYAKRGILCENPDASDHRCLGCSTVCENCVEVCPNRANLAIIAKETGHHQILHVDEMCNECGNCKSFCPYSSSPYLDKLTLFANQEGMDESENDGFYLTKSEVTLRFSGKATTYPLSAPPITVPVEIQELITSIVENYSYLLS